MDLPVEGKEYLLIMAAYAMGCFTSGYYLVRWRMGKDIRLAGSGSVGATNASRFLGRRGFILTFLLDCFKGAMIVWLARGLRLGSMAVLLMMIAVVAGHLYPVQLRFRGGKGIATSIGALLAYNYLFVLILIGLFAVIRIPLRNFVLSGLAAFAILPLALYVLQFSVTSIWGTTALTVLILIAHRRNIPEELRRIIISRKLASTRHSAGDE
jgi:glycerol-3-phosphate acyltransferase PlsY